LERILFEIAYNGANYHGWQKQDNASTVQETIEKNLSILLKSKINIVGCGRTDTGVHAEQYFFHVDISKDQDFDSLLNRLNLMLPQEILIKSYEIKNPDFHARFSAISRTYEYRISQKKEPFLNSMFNHISHNIDIDLMNESCSKLIGLNDFRSFSKVHTDVNNFKCYVYEAFWTKKNHQIIFTIKANRFLRNMVRAIVGTMLLIGRNKISVQEFCNIIASKSRSSAGPSVKAKGLFLTKVNYNNNA
jgi:tRNA pseudouridine38-40 synthase